MRNFLVAGGLLITLAGPSMAWAMRPMPARGGLEEALRPSAHRPVAIKTLDVVGPWWIRDLLSTHNVHVWEHRVRTGRDEPATGTIEVIPHPELDGLPLQTGPGSACIVAVDEWMTPEQVMEYLKAAQIPVAVLFHTVTDTPVPAVQTVLDRIRQTSELNGRRPVAMLGVNFDQHAQVIHGGWQLLDALNEALVAAGAEEAELVQQAVGSARAVSTSDFWDDLEEALASLAGQA